MSIMDFARPTRARVGQDRESSSFFGALVEDDPGYEPVKRAVDIFASATLLVLTAPIMLGIVLAVRLTSPGAAVFRQKRLGRWGREFWCYKFRTMIVDAEAALMKDKALREKFEANFKLKVDPRVTKIGAFLRKTSLDELPQLFNVLRGDLSMIGPRPIVPRELAKYGDDAKRLLSVKPGLGGLWQVYGRSDTSYETRVRLDVAYVETRRHRLDLALMIETARVVLMRKGAY